MTNTEIVKPIPRRGLTALLAAALLAAVPAGAATPAVPDESPSKASY